MNDHSRDEIIDAEIVDAQIVPAEAVPPAPPQGNRRGWLMAALIGVGVVGFVALAAFVISNAKQEDADKVADMVRNHPMVIEQLGGIDQCTWNTFASLNEGGKRTEVFDVRGPNGSGQFVTYEFLYKFRSITLRTDNGEWELLE